MSKKVDQQGLAAILHCTTRTIANLEGHGVFKRGDDGRYDALACASALLKHRRDDAEARAARAELARVEARRRELLLRQRVGALVSRAELGEFADLCFGAAWEAWTAAVSRLFGALQQIPERERRVLVHGFDEGGKDELRMLRDRLDAMVRAGREDLRDPKRVEAKLADLDTPHEG